jgi:hypothetical protein
VLTSELFAPWELTVKDVDAMSNLRSIGRKAALLAATVGMAVGLASPANAVVRPAYSPSSYVVLSMPLINFNTGVASWNYGYVQLWYDPVAGRNWARTVSKLPGTTEVYANDYRQPVNGGLGSANAYVDDTNGSVAGYDSTGSYVSACSASLGAVCSYEIYSPNNNDTADGVVWANGVYYHATAGQ